MIQHALVVDDSKSARFMLCKMLERSGLRVDSSVSAEEALAYLADHSPDVIFMDHMMPGMDGLEATRTIKQDPRLANIPVVLFTSKEGPQYRREASESGAEDVLPKPPTADAVATLLARLSEQAEATPSVIEADGALNDAAVRSMVGEMVDAAFEKRLAAQLEALVEGRLDTVDASLQEQLHRTEERVTDTLMTVVDTRMKEAGEAIVAQSGAQIGPVVDARLHDFEAGILAKAEQRITPVVEVSTRLGIENAIESANAGQRAELRAAIDRAATQLSSRIERHRAELAQRVVDLQHRLDAVLPSDEGDTALDDKILGLASQVVERAFERFGGDLSTAAQRDAGAIAGHMMERHVAKLSEQMAQATAEAERRSVGSARLYAIVAAVAGVGAGIASALLL